MKIALKIILVIMKNILVVVLLFLTISFKAQFPGAAGTVGTSAMYKDSSAFVGWATTCVISRGYQDIANIALGTATVGVDLDGTLKAGVNGVASLGDKGSATLTFQSPITNGPGFDFAVFENGFDDTFLELAFVEVSSDGINFFRFPATSNTQTITQVGAFDALDPTKLNNLAGKYRALYGTPFDLQELSGKAGLNIDAITHIKIIDVVGSLNPLYASYDKNDNPINDPYPTAFASGGFDLDAVGIINQLPVSVKEQQWQYHVNVFPNPSSDFIFVYSEPQMRYQLVLTDLNGITLRQTNQHMMNISDIDSGIYFLKISNEAGEYTVKRILKN